MMKNFYPSNVDLLNIGNGCNLNCQQCYYEEDFAAERVMKDDLILAERLIKKFDKSSIFIYPKEITTNVEIVHLMANVGQKSVLSNGIMLDEKMVDLFIGYGISEIKITLFANYKEHAFFNQITPDQYKLILNGIMICKRKGMSVVVNTILSKVTKDSIVALAQKSFDLGVDKIEFLRLKPVGRAAAISPDVWINEMNMMEIIATVEDCKLRYPHLYFRYNLNCGPDFYGKTIEQAEEKIERGSKEWTKSKYLCPSIDGNYLGISLRTGNIYSCFFATGHSEFVIGEIDLKNGEIAQLNNPELISETLSKKLTGNCQKDECKYQEVCLGGCRSTAFVFAKLRREKDPMFAGMDLCVTKCKEKMFA